MLQKLISSYELVYHVSVNEKALFEKCQVVISSIEKVEKEINGEHNLGNKIFSFYFLSWFMYDYIDKPVGWEFIDFSLFICTILTII